MPLTGTTVDPFFLLQESRNEEHLFFILFAQDPFAFQLATGWFQVVPATLLIPVIFFLFFVVDKLNRCVYNRVIYVCDEFIINPGGCFFIDR
jgi:hypothetical protein